MLKTKGKLQIKQPKLGNSGWNPEKVQEIMPKWGQGQGKCQMESRPNRPICHRLLTLFRWRVPFSGPAPTGIPR